MTELVLVTTTDCGFCDHAKSVLARLQGELQFEIREVALDSAEGRELAARAGVPFPPVLFIDDQPAFYGRLSERKLRQALS